MQKLLARIGLALGLVLFVPAVAVAQAWPQKPVKMIVPFPAGGGTDFIARLVARHLTDRLGQQVFVENRAGANGSIGLQALMTSDPDGYTIAASSDTPLVVNPWLYDKLPYDSANDFVPITGLISISQALTTNPSVPAQNLPELIELAKKRPSELNYGTFGVGSTGHLNMQMLQNLAGITLVPVHYKGATPALTDVIAGHIQMMFINTSSAIEPWKAGRLRLLAVGSSKRLARYPEIPTVGESGLPGFEAVSWFGLFAPRGTPQEIIARINAEVRQAFEGSELRKFLADNMFEPMLSSPEQFSAFINIDAEKWHNAVRNARIKPE